MNTTSRAGWLLAAWLLAAGCLTAQSSVQDDLQRADKQFDLYAYNLALRTYEQVLQKDPNNARALSRTADSYFQLNRIEESLPWYERAAQQYNVEPITFLNYGKALMQTGDYVGAKKWFRVYGESNSAAAQQYINMCDYAIDVSKKEAIYTVKNEPMNTEVADFCATFMAGKVVFSSARTDIARKTQSKTNSDWSGGAYNQLFVTQRSAETGFLQKPAFLRSDLQNTFNEGPVSFSADGKKVAFCRNNFIDGTRQIADKGINMSLYIADVVDGNWLNIKAFPFNGSDYATGFPALSPDGNTLIFSSNQPGGSGGWDIYVSNWSGNSWSTPRNIGEPLNTPGNEVTPFYDGKDLYFSSDWHRGLGGLDVFRAELGRDKVSNIFHLGPGINSSRDDYGFVFDANQNIGYVTSTRPTGRGHEDIWQVTKKGGATSPVAYSNTPSTPFNQGKTSTATTTPVEYSTTTTVTNYGSGSGTLYLLVTDKVGNPVANADLDFSDCNAGFGQTDYEGKYYFSALTWPLRCNVVIKKQGYFEESVLLENYGKGNLMIAITPDDRKEYIGAVRDAQSRILLDGVNVEIQKNETGQSIFTNTDYDGRYSLFLTPYSAYDVTYAKSGYKSRTVRVNTGAAGTGISDIGLEPIVSTVAAGNRPAEYSTPTLIASKKTEEPTPAQGEFNGYAVQVAAYPDELTETKLKKYEELSQYGNLYAKSEGGRNKVRLGIFPNKSDAQDALKKVLKNPKFKGSFVTEEYGADPGLVLGNNNNPSLRPTEYSTVSKGISPAAPVIRYSVQLGSFAADRPIEIGDFTKASGIGHIYTKLENGMNKVRLGVFPTHEAAEQAQTEAVARGYRDAIIVTEKSTDESLKDFLLSNSSPIQPVEAGTQPAQYSTPATKPQKAKSTTENVLRPTEYSTPSTVKPKYTPYYVRIATLSNPERFDSTPFADLGNIERKKSETGSTIILLGAYEKIEEVTSALNAVRTRGFEEAYAVRKDDKGNLTRIK